MKTVYLAGKQNAGEAGIASFAEELEENGHDVLEKWWEKGVLPKPYLDNPETSRPAAKAMIDAAYNSDVFVLFSGESVMGAMAEFGAALGSTAENPDKFIYLLYPEQDRQSIFYVHPAVIAIESLDRIRRSDWF